MAALSRCDRAQCRAGDSRRRLDGGDAIARRIQPDLDAAYAVDQNLADRARRQLRLDAAGSSIGLYADLLRHDHSAAGGDATVRRERTKEMSALAGHGAS